MKFNEWYLEFLTEDKTGLSDRELLFMAFTAGENSNPVEAMVRCELKIDKTKNCFVLGKKEYPPTQHNLEIYKKLLSLNETTKDLINGLSTVSLDI